MSEQFTTDAHAVVGLAQERARRLGHHWIGCEHLLLALSSTEGEVGEFLREQGVTPQRVQAQIVRMTGLGGTHVFDTLDRDALASIGIDLDVVRGRIEAALGPHALTPTPRRPRQPPWRRARRRGIHPTERLPLTPRAKKCLQHSSRQAQASHSGHAGIEHLAIALITMHDRMAPRILSAIGASAPHLHTQLLNHYRQAN